MANPNRRYPREMPLDKPSAVNAFVPQSLTRTHTCSNVWMPTPRATTMNKRDARKVERFPTQQVDLPVQSLLELEEKVLEVEHEVNAFLDEFHAAATVFSAQMNVQKRFVQCMCSVALIVAML
ncbi:hypothetical protein Ae201684P_000999 [Aphanomyces euteiches]|nr:hypothetical protein Ae201684P_000999 [Aphanomyces euteiches]